MAGRTAHYLRNAKGAAQPPALIGVSAGKREDGKVIWSLHTDAASRVTEPEIRYSSGVGSESFWAALKGEIKRSPGCWATFLGAVEQLAILGFWDLLEEDRWKLTDADPIAPGMPIERSGRTWEGYAVLQDPPTIIVARPCTNSGTCKFLDLRNYGVSGWSALGDNSNKPATEGCDHIIRSRLVLLFMREWCSMVRSHGFGGVQATAASQAMHTYRHRYLRSPVLVHDNRDALDLERQAMYAGRCECWTVGRVKGPVYHLDCNSCYPAAALGQLMPARLAGYTRNCSPSPAALIERGYLVISEVTLEAQEACFPVRFNRVRHGPDYVRGCGGLCSHMPFDGDQIYPTGTIHTSLCGPELSLALERGCVRRIWRTAWYEPADLFSEFVSDLAAAQEACRATGRIAQAEAIKRLRNSLFGKFAQWSWRWKSCPEQHAPAPYALWYGLPVLAINLDADEPRLDKDRVAPSRTGLSGLVRYRSIGWSTQVEEGMGEHPESCPAISAWVYSLARVNLLRAIAIAGEENVHYMDADSIWCNHTGFTRMQNAGTMHQTEMGKWKEKGVYEWVDFHGLKQYSTPDSHIHAGAPPDAAGSRESGWTYQRSEALMPALAARRPPGAVTVTHQLRAGDKYRIGRVCAGGRVVPFVFREE